MRVAVQDGSLTFLFENKGSMYEGKGFEMLAALNRHCRPDTVANAFSTLMSLFKDSMGDLEDIIAFCSRFDGMINEMSRCKIVIPHLLMVMFFLRSLHSRYSPLLDQFRSRARPLETASLESIFSDVHFHDKFTVVGKDNKPKGGLKLRLLRPLPILHPPARLTRMAKPGTIPGNGLLISSMRALSGRGICPICHREGDHHAPAACPLLVELNLKLIKVAPVGSGSSLPPAAAPAPSPSPGRRSAVTDENSASGSSGSVFAPSGLIAKVEAAHGDNYDSGDEFRWDGNDNGSISATYAGVSPNLVFPSLFTP